MRVGWQATDWVSFSVVGQNLTNKYHSEFTSALAGTPSMVPRSVYGKMELNF